MRASREGQPLVEKRPSLSLVQVKELALASHVCRIQVVAAHLVLVLQEQLAVGRPRLVTVADVPEVPRALQGHEDALQPVGDLDRHGVAPEGADLLEVGEL